MNRIHKHVLVGEVRPRRWRGSSVGEATAEPRSVKPRSTRGGQNRAVVVVEGSKGGSDGNEPGGAVANAGGRCVNQAQRNNVVAWQFARQCPPVSKVRWWEVVGRRRRQKPVQNSSTNFSMVSRPAVLTVREGRLTSNVKGKRSPTE